MAVAFNSSAVSPKLTGTSVLFSYTSGSGANRLLLANTPPPVGGGSVTGVTYGGAALANVGAYGSVMWAKAGQLSGANNLVFSLSTYASIIALVADWSGVDQVTPTGAVTGAVGTGTTPATPVITCPPGGAIYGVTNSNYAAGAAPTAGAATTLASSVRDGGSGYTYAGGYSLATGSLSWSNGATSWTTAGLPINAVVTAATDVTMSGPSSGTTGVASSNFSIGVAPGGGTVPGTVVVTPSDSGAGGTFLPTTVSLTTGSPTATFTYTPASVGAKTISVTNNGALTNPSPMSYTSNAASISAPSAKVSRCSQSGINFFGLRR